MSETPFTTHGDEPVEARIVSWVLGEASAFEAAELERLCEERPELMVFKRRMLALHGLLIESETARADDDKWKLPPEKRKTVDILFGEQNPIRLELEKEKRIRHSGRRVLLAIAACVVITLFITRLQPWKQTSEAILEVKPLQSGMTPLGADMTESSGRMTPQFFATEHEKVKSRQSLEKVVDNLDLDKRWNMDKEDAVAKLKDSIKTENIRGTDMLKIQVRRSDKKEADEITREVAYAYKDHREQLEKHVAERQLSELNKAVQDQEDKVEERRKVLATIVRNKGIIYKGQDSFYNSGGVDEDSGARNAQQVYHEIEQEKKQLESQVKSLLKYNSDDLMVYAGGLNLPDNPVRELYPKYQEAKRQLDGLKISGLADNHPTVKTTVDQVENTKRQLDEGVVNLRATLQAQLDLASNRLKSVEIMKDDEREEAIKRGLDAQDYADAKREFETDQQLLQTMKLKQMGETISRKASSDSVVIHEVPGSKSSTSETQALASNSPRTRRLETALPNELIEGTPKPMNVPNLETPMSGPAGSSTWSNEESQLAQNEKKRSQVLPETTSPPMPPAAPASRSALAIADSSNDVLPEPTIAFGGMKGASYDLRAEAGSPVGGELASRQPRPRIRPEPSQPVAELAPASNADPFEDEGEATSRLAERQSVTKSGSAFLSYNSGGAMPAEELAIEGNRSGSGSIEKGNIDALLEKDSESLGEKAGSAGKEMAQTGDTPADMQTLGKLISQDDKSDHTSGSDYTDRTGTLSGTNTYSGDTTVTGGALGIGGSGGGGGFAASESDAKPKEPGMDPDDSSLRLNDALTDGASKKDEGKLVGGIDIVGGSKFALKLGDTSEYHLRDASLGKGKAVVPDDPDALAKAIREHEDKVEERRKVLANILRNRGIIYKGQDQDARNVLLTYHEIELEKMQLESQISSLLKYDSDELMHYASNLNVQDNAVRELYPKYFETKRQLDSEKNKGLDDKHPSVKATAKQVEALKRQIDEGVVNIRSTLQAQLELTTNRLKGLEVMKENTREDAIKRDFENHDHAEIRREYEEELRLLQQVKLKQIEASMKHKPEPPKPDLTKLMEEIPTSEDPYSTFSLNISDASFQIAQAALAKGERPDPAGIKVEQFYNAVDYGDPAPSANEPVAVNIEQSAHPVIPGRNLVRVALKTAAAGRSAAQPLRLTLLVDQSGSMVREDRRAAMDKALAGLSELLTQNDLVTVIGFSRTPRLLADGMTGDKAGKLADLVNQAASEGGTNLEEAIKLADQMAVRQKLAGAQNRIVLFTDGAANLGNADPARLAEHVKQLRQKGIAFDIAGIAADGLNDELLGELARNGNGRYYVVGKGGDDHFAKQLAGAFRPAAENVKVQVRFNPERVGRYKLIGFEKDRLKTEDFRNDRVDAAELAAEEAGVAIYQVETLPEGNGELGEVSVRFRDAARGEMVERAWTIPHDAAVPAIDRARPSMQLAVLAMLAGEKLKGGPLADAIDFKQLADSMAEVKHYYGGDGRVGGMLRVVELLK